MLKPMSFPRLQAMTVLIALHCACSWSSEGLSACWVCLLQWHQILSFAGFAGGCWGVEGGCAEGGGAKGGCRKG